MTDWNQLHGELEIQGGRRKKRTPTARTIEKFESDTGITLPKSYKEFAELFGAGELAGYYRFTVPLGRSDQYDLATFNETSHGSSDDDTWGEYASPQVLEKVLFFASTIGGELFAWRTDEVTNSKNSEYAVYRFLRRPKLREVAKSFEEFFDKCLKGKLDSFDEPPPKSYLKY
jgi:hypothetical protein